MMNVKPIKEILLEVDTTAGSLYVEGIVYDASTNKPVTKGTVQMVVNATGQPLTSAANLDSSGGYQGWTNMEDRFTDAIKFSSPGYADQTIQFSKLELKPNVYLVPVPGGTNDFPAWQIAIVLAAVYAYTRKKKKKQIGGLTTGDVMPILLLAGGVLGFSLIKSILEKLGLWDSKDTKDLDAAAQDPNSFWNPNYWLNKPANVSFTYPITQATANQWAGEIYNSFGAWNDCEECVKAVFRRARTKANISFLSWEFNNRYGFDLLDFLRGGLWPQDRLSAEDVNEINHFVSNLPKY